MPISRSLRLMRISQTLHHRRNDREHPVSMHPVSMHLLSMHLVSMRFAALVAACSCATVSYAQSAPATKSTTEGTAAAGVLQPRLEIVDQGTEDRDVMSATLRTDPTDLRLPTEFERVYRVPGSSSLLMRGNGALFAVFEQSVYRQTSRGVQVVAPPGTVFHIGMPSAQTTRNNASVTDAPTKPADARRIPTQIAAPMDARIGPVHAAVAIPHATQSSLGQTEPRTNASSATSAKEFETLPKPSLANPVAASPANSSTSSSTNSSTTASTTAAPSTQKIDAYAHLQLGPARIVHASSKTSDDANEPPRE